MSTIRLPEPSDDDALFRLVCAFPTPTPPNRDTFLAALRSKSSNPSSCLFIAETDGHAIGYISGYAHETFYAGGPTAWVDEVLIAEPLRGRGYGRELMNAFERWAVQRGCVLVSLATRGAAPFYEHLGYETRAAYYKDLGDGTGHVPRDR